MAVETDDDRLTFVSADEFGDRAIYTPAGGAGSSLTGIFDLPHIDVSFADIAVSDRRPTFCCRSTDLPDGAAGDAGDVLEVDGMTFKVLDLQPDGQGMVLIPLGKES